MLNVVKTQIFIMLILVSTAAKAGQPNHEAIGQCLGIVAVLSDKYGVSFINKRTNISKGVITQYSGKIEQLVPKLGQCQQYYRTKNIPIPDSAKDAISQCGVKLAKVDKEILIGYVSGFSAATTNEAYASSGVDLICLAGTGG